MYYQQIMTLQSCKFSCYILTGFYYLIHVLINRRSDSNYMYSCISKQRILSLILLLETEMLSLKLHQRGLQIFSQHVQARLDFFKDQHCIWECVVRSSLITFAQIRNHTPGIQDEFTKIENQQSSIDITLADFKISIL